MASSGWEGSDAVKSPVKSHERRAHEIEDTKEDIKSILRDSVERDAMLQCEEIDRLITLALRMLPPEIRRMRASQALMPVERLFQEGPSQVSTPVPSASGTRAGSAATLGGSVKISGSGVLALQRSASGGSVPTASVKVSESVAYRSASRGSSDDDGGLVCLAARCKTIEQRIPDETQEQRMLRLRLGMEQLNEVSLEISTVSDKLDDLKSVELTATRRSLLDNLGLGQKTWNTAERLSPLASKRTSRSGGA